MNVLPPYRGLLLLRRHRRPRCYGTLWSGAFMGTIKARNARDAERQMRANCFMPTAIGFLWEEKA